MDVVLGWYDYSILEYNIKDCSERRSNNNATKHGKITAVTLDPEFSTKLWLPDIYIGKSYIF